MNSFSSKIKSLALTSAFFLSACGGSDENTNYKTPINQNQTDKTSEQIALEQETILSKPDKTNINNNEPPKKPDLEKIFTNEEYQSGMNNFKIMRDRCPTLVGLSYTEGECFSGATFLGRNPENGLECSIKFTNDRKIVIENGLQKTVPFKFFMGLYLKFTHSPKDWAISFLIDGEKGGNEGLRYTGQKVWLDFKSRDKVIITRFSNVDPQKGPEISANCHIPVPLERDS